jgi:hypothetical protein
MKRFKFKPMTVAASLALVATAAYAAAFYIKLDTPLVVSTDDPANNAFKAKMGWISYKSDVAQPQFDVKAQVLVYADGAAGKQNIWIARSTDNGATWVQQQITTNGGNPLTITDGALTETFDITNNKPNIYVAPVGMILAGKGADALVSWTSSDCEGSAVQKINTNLLTGHQPYMCLWAARSTDGGVTWTSQRLTDGSLDPDEDVPAGYVKSDLTAGGFAISYQADPAGLQQGDAEGPGDGASGAKVSAGTNIWYTFLNKANFEAGINFPAPKQVSDNNDTTVGAPGASRANLAISGGTAVLAYEELKGDGSSGKQIVYHSFNYLTPQTDNAGTVISNTFNNARRVRFMLQGNDSIADADVDGDAADGDSAGVHVALLWRESTTTEPAAAADIVFRRGIKDTVLRPGSTGFLATDVTADAPVNLSDTGVNDNALAHRGVLRGEFVSVAYDQTPDKTAADAYTGTYNLFIKRSTDGGTTWSAAKNMSNLPDSTTRVVEPRQVPTPGTIKLPDGTATNDPSDVQDRNVIFVAWGTETNEEVGKPLDIYMTRTTDQGVSYETVQKLASGVTEQSEAQLRSPPDGKTLGALWMEHDVALGTTDVMYRNGIEDVAPPPPAPSGGGGGGCAIGGDGRFDPMLPALLVAGMGLFGWRRFKSGK